ncbi:GNAT family N-acetyltransferase [bacterium]|nr:GNAT family N-acetyltransferase [bacterium]
MKLNPAPEFSAKIPGSPSGRVSPHSHNPSLATRRLVLRLPVIGDFLAYRDFVTGPRTAYMGGPHDAAKAWDWFCNDVAQWALLRLGGLTMTLAGKPIGQVAVCYGPNLPEPELGWFLYDAAHEGQGYAFEAAEALRDWALGPRGLPNLVSYIDPANAASIRLATRLGGTPDPLAATPGGAACLTYRYAAPKEMS